MSKEKIIKVKSLIVTTWEKAQKLDKMTWNLTNTAVLGGDGEYALIINPSFAPGDDDKLFYPMSAVISDVLPDVEIENILNGAILLEKTKTGTLGNLRLVAVKESDFIKTNIADEPHDITLDALDALISKAKEIMNAEKEDGAKERRFEKAVETSVFTLQHACKTNCPINGATGGLYDVHLGNNGTGIKFYIYDLADVVEKLAPANFNGISMIEGICMPNCYISTNGMLAAKQLSKPLTISKIQQLLSDVNFSQFAQRAVYGQSAGANQFNSQQHPYGNGFTPYGNGFQPYGFGQQVNVQAILSHITMMKQQINQLEAMLMQPLNQNPLNAGPATQPRNW